MPSNRRLVTTLALTAYALLGLQAAHAQATMDHSAMGHTTSAAKSLSVAMTDGEVKKMDAKAQTITLAHGPIKNLDMPAMTMVFKVKTPALLAKVKVGDKVKFSAEMPDGALTVTALELAR